MVGGDGVGDGLQQHRLAGAGRRNNQPALALADRSEQVHDAAGEVLARGFELHPLIGIERREVVEEDLVARFLGRLEVDGVHLDQREIALAFLGRADLAGDGVAGAQVEAADLRRRDVDVVRPGQVVVLGGAQEAEAVGQAFEHAFGEDQAALFRLRLQDLEDQLLLAQAGGAGDVHVLGHLVELLDAHILQLDQVERGRAVLGALRGLLLAALLAEVALDGRRRGFGGGGGRRRWRSDCRGRRGRRRRRRRRRSVGLERRRRGTMRPLRFLGGRLVGRRSRDRPGRRGGLFRGAVMVGRVGPGRGSGRRHGRFVGGFFRFFRWFLRWDGPYRGWIVFAIACQISLTPRPVTAENGSGSTPSWRMARRPRSCSD